MHTKRTVEVRKTAIFVIVINSLQIAMMILLLVLVFMGHARTLARNSGRALAVIATLIVASGAYFDIRDAMHTRELLSQSEDMISTIQNMSSLNNALRAQRHDFMNHLQVVFSLIEMHEYDEANRYIEKVYGQIQALSSTMKTANPAVNALLRVKTAAAQRSGVQVSLEIHSDWRDLPVEGWEVCKILSNLIDNALDALENAPEPRRLRIRLDEDLKHYVFEIGNTGTPIPQEIQDQIFQPGFSTKGDGHGMGLAIVHRALEAAGGSLALRSDETETAFTITIPRAQAAHP